MLCPCGELGKCQLKSQLPPNSHISCRTLFLPPFPITGLFPTQNLPRRWCQECLEWIKAAFCSIDLLFSLSGVWISPGRSQRARGCLSALRSISQLIHSGNYREWRGWMLPKPWQMLVQMVLAQFPLTNHRVGLSRPSQERDCGVWSDPARLDQGCASVPCPHSLLVAGLLPHWF